jgi:hypothetical protein
LPSVFAMVYGESWWGAVMMMGWKAWRCKQPGAVR